MIVTEIAKSKIADLIKAPKEIMPDQNFFLRITAVEDNGIKYQTYFDFEIRSDDTLVRFKNFDLRVDKDSMPHLELATLDYDEEQGFSLVI